MTHLPERSSAARLWLDETGRRYMGKPRGTPYLSGLGAEEAPDDGGFFSSLTDLALEKVKTAAGEGAEAQVAPHIRNLYIMSGLGLLAGGLALFFVLRR